MAAIDCRRIWPVESTRVVLRTGFKSYSHGAFGNSPNSGSETKDLPLVRAAEIDWPTDLGVGFCKAPQSGRGMADIAECAALATFPV